MKDLLKIRKEKQAKQPKFTRHASHRKDKLEDGKWRSPRGLHNKLRLRKKSRGVAVKNGYRTPVKVRGLAQSGKKQLLVRSIAELDHAEPDMHAIIIGRVGKKRRVELLKEAAEQGFEVLNLDAKQASEIEAEVKSRSKKSDERKSKRKALEDAAKKSAKKAEEKEAATKAPAKTPKKTAPAEPEEAVAAKEAEKKEHDKILTKKD